MSPNVVLYSGSGTTMTLVNVPGTGTSTAAAAATVQITVALLPWLLVQTLFLTPIRRHCCRLGAPTIGNHPR
jgi:hypothetical protein